MRTAQDVHVLSGTDGVSTATRSLRLALIVGAVVAVIDQVTKRWADNRLVAGPCTPTGDECIDLFWTARFHLHYNPGAAFSTGRELGPLFGVLAIIMTVVLLNLARKRGDRLGPILLGAIAGGAVGNLVDRVTRAEDGPLSGSVIDFIDFQWWPIFNVADAAVVVGVIVFIVYSLFDPEAGIGETDDDDSGVADDTYGAVSGDADTASDEAVSGDGDTASIGLSQFCHAMRRQLNMTYIVMNNGCYGLTKGQFSATNDKASPSKKGESNLFEAIDLAQIAIQLGAGFVGRSFSGDKAQLVPLIEAAMSYNGFAFLDVISPCVTFNNHPTSTKSYDYVRGHNAVLDKLDFVPAEEEIEIDYAEGTTSEVELHGGAKIHLHKLDTGYDPTNADQAINTIRTRLNEGEVTTGLLYFDGREQDLHETLHTSERPLNQVPITELCPGSEALAPINDRFR